MWRMTWLLAILMLLVGVAALAGETLTIQLNSPEPERQPEQSSDLRLRHETLTTGGGSNIGCPIQASNASGNFSAQEVTIGLVGVVRSPKADILRFPGRSVLLYSCSKDTYAAVISQSGDWYGILMVDGSTGWIHKKHIEVLQYQVVASVSASAAAAKAIMDSALRFLGIQYKWGGYSLDGLDCSGFVKAVFASNGIALPRTSREQAKVGVLVSWDQIQPGDRLYFACKGGDIDHAGIYIGNGYFIHSSARRGGVAVDTLRSLFWASTLVAARRSL